MQVPAPTTVTVLPETVQTDEVEEEKLTGKDDVAVADNGNGEVPNVTPLGEPKEMVWPVGFTVKLCVIVVAAR